MRHVEGHMRIRRFAQSLIAIGWFAACLAGTALPAQAQTAAPSSKGQATKKKSPQASTKSTPSKSASKPTKNQPKKSSKSTAKKRPKQTRKPGEPGQPDDAARRIISGTSTIQGKSIQESPELRAMREIDLALFPSAAPTPNPPWPAAGLSLLDPQQPTVDASGLPPSGLLPTPSADTSPSQDLSWLRQLEMPDIPVRWDGRVVRYLEHYKNNPHGRSAVAIWIRKSGRYSGLIRRVLREQHLPDDIFWLALVESGFDPAIYSPAGAAGLWQFMPEGARIYGLTVDRWVDERLDPERSTLAATRYLADLYQRFGGWELAFAAYNMGYGGLLAAIRKYNTNDFWELSRLEAGMPLETALYVPKIIAMAIVARNKKIFGCDDIEIDPAVAFDKITVPSGVMLDQVASASGTTLAQIESLNPHFTAKRTPPDDQTRWEVRIPPGTAAKAAKSLPKVTNKNTQLDRYQVRWGECLDDIAALYGTSRSTLQSLNGLRSDETVRPGTLLFVPNKTPPNQRTETARPLVIPAQQFSYQDRRRVFYHVISGDTLRELAPILSVSVDDICRWNMLDPRVALHDGMTLQVYVPKTKRLDDVYLLEETDVQLIEVGSDAFFTHFEGLKGRKRIEIIAKEGDDWRKLARRYGLSIGMMERINHRSRSSTLRPGEKVIVYAPNSQPTKPSKEPVAVAASVTSIDDQTQDTDSDSSAEPEQTDQEQQVSLAEKASSKPLDSQPVTPTSDSPASKVTKDITQNPPSQSAQVTDSQINSKTNSSTTSKSKDTTKPPTNPKQQPVQKTSPQKPSSP